MGTIHEVTLKVVRKTKFGKKKYEIRLLPHSYRTISIKTPDPVFSGIKTAIHAELFARLQTL